MTKLPTYYNSPHEIAGVDKKAPVLLALSGGADSVSLLYNLVTESKSEGFEVFAAHVNHNIRLDGYGNEAKRDEDFCRELCERLGIRLFVKSVDVPTLAKALGESIEGAARRVRYEFFSEIMREQGISLLVTAHNASDNFETQIFNLCRGSSLAGICGIPRRRSFDGDKLIVRPILSGTKAEILGFCEENSISFVTDSTNLETDATRNKIRNIIVPELEKIFPSAQSAAARLAMTAADAVEYISGQAQAYLDGASATDGKISFSCESFLSLHISLQREVVSLAAKKLGVGLEYTHIQSVVRLIANGVPHSGLNLPSGLICRIEDGRAVISAKDEDVVSADYEISFNGSLAELDSAGFCVVAGEKNLSKINTEIYTLYTNATLKGDKIKDGLLAGRGMLRSRREGDRIIDGGNTKRLKKLMCDKKIPMNIRNSLPILTLDGEIVYVPMCAISDSAKRGDEGEIQIFIYKKL